MPPSNAWINHIAVGMQGLNRAEARNAAIRYDLVRSYLWTACECDQKREFWGMEYFNKGEDGEELVLVVLRGKANVEEFKKRLPDAAFDDTSLVVRGCAVSVIFVNEETLSLRKVPKC